MLTLTMDATTTIRNIVDHSEVPAGGGLRIANDPAENALTLSLAAVPAEDDQVLDDSGARVFLDPAAARLLDDKMLDAEADSEGRVKFAVSEQP